MSKYRVRTADDLLTVEASSYVQDSAGLKLYNGAGEFLAQFNSFLSVVRVDALVTDDAETAATVEPETVTTETVTPVAEAEPAATETTTTAAVTGE